MSRTRITIEVDIDAGPLQVARDLGIRRGQVADYFARAVLDGPLALRVMSPTRVSVAVANLDATNLAHYDRIGR